LVDISIRPCMTEEAEGIKGSRNILIQVKMRGKDLVVYVVSQITETTLKVTSG